MLLKRQIKILYEYINNITQILTDDEMIAVSVQNKQMLVVSKDNLEVLGGVRLVNKMPVVICNSLSSKSFIIFKLQELYKDAKVVHEPVVVTGTGQILNGEEAILYHSPVQDNYLN